MELTTRTLRIAQIIPETFDTKTFVLQPVDDAPFEYQAGQFLTLLFEEYGHEVRRSFSFSTAPGSDKLPAITIKRVANGLISRRLLDYAKEGDVLTSLEPSGRFVIPAQAVPRHVFLIGAGSGITPLFSLLKQLLYAESQTYITLLYSNRTIESTIFYEQLQKLQKAYPERLKVVFFWGNAKNLRQARLNNSLLEEIVRQHLISSKDDALFYTCGPLHFMLMVQITLLTMGFDKENIHREFYTVDTKPPTPKQYEPQSVTLEFKGVSTIVEVSNNLTILDAGVKAGLPLPYNCRSGQCGSCIAQCSKGVVEMEYNEILTDEEVTLGRVLTCMAHPLTSDVRVTW
ncbi:2Fe-2S iron-sulfur cluster-binding protein [Runella sp.]|uniref:2Fe-2S iron-sulfur cluster-binding protein n=1 Tax=Runella sp. TaxID=1960881 RepID=UPI003D13E64B